MPHFTDRSIDIPARPSTRHVVDTARQLGMRNAIYVELVLSECSNKRLIQVINTEDWIVLRYRVDKLNEWGNLSTTDCSTLVEAMNEFGFGIEEEPF